MPSLRSAVHRLIGLIPPGLVRPIVALQHRSDRLRRLYVWLTRWMRRTDVVIAHGAGAGLRFNPGGANVGYGMGSNEPAVQDAIVRHVRPGAVFFDVGANVGFHTVIAARCTGPAGRVVAFEPLPANAAALRHNVALNRFTHVQVVAAAVAANEGRARLALAEEPTWAHLAGGDAAAAERTIDVRVVGIDALVAAGEVPPPDVVKIDVEGAELDVLRGMMRTLRERRPVIICELHDTARAAAAFFQGAGYDVQALESDLPVEELTWSAHVLAVPHPVPAARA